MRVNQNKCQYCRFVSFSLIRVKSVDSYNIPVLRDEQSRAEDHSAIKNIYIFIAIALDESNFLDVLHFPMKTLSHVILAATPLGEVTSKQASDVVCLLLLM